MVGGNSCTFVVDSVTVVCICVVAFHRDSQ